MLTVKAVHLEAVSDLMSDAYIAAVQQFVSCCGATALVWDDNRTNFVGANRGVQILSTPALWTYDD